MSFEQTLEAIVEKAVVGAFEQIQTGDSFPPVMTMEQVCKYTQYSRPTILKFIEEKGFPVSRQCDSPRFVRSEVDKWLKGEI